MSEIKLTQYSHGAGCGCKISPQVLDVILKGNIAMPDNDKLIIANYIANQSSGFRTIDINKEYEFVTSEFILTIDENLVSKFNFHLTYEDINE